MKIPSLANSSIVSIIPMSRRMPYFFGCFTPALTAIPVKHSRGTPGVNGRISSALMSQPRSFPSMSFSMVSCFSGMMVRVSAKALEAWIEGREQDA